MVRLFGRNAPIKCQHSLSAIKKCVCIGGYTPIKWIPKGGWLKDESKTSSLKEYYTITKGEYAIHCNSSAYGPIFGYHSHYSIDLNFQDRHSNMTG